MPVARSGLVHDHVDGVGVSAPFVVDVQQAGRRAVRMAAADVVKVAAAYMSFTRKVAKIMETVVKSVK